MKIRAGSNPVVGTSLKYKHINNNRAEFNRFKKGRTNEFNCKPYLFPIHDNVKNYHDFRNNYSKVFRSYLAQIGITEYFTSKSARYSFINIGKQLQLNRDVLMELTGHSRGDVHSIYESGFSNEIKDEVHRKILDAVFKT